MKQRIMLACMILATGVLLSCSTEDDIPGDPGILPSDTPTLLSPIRGDNVRLNQFSFRWTSVPNAVSYIIEVGDTAQSTFTAVLSDQVVETDCTLHLDNSVLGETVLWHVRAVGANGEMSSWSGTESFRVDPRSRLHVLIENLTREYQTEGTEGTERRNDLDDYQDIQFGAPVIVDDELHYSMRIEPNVGAISSDLITAESVNLILRLDESQTTITEAVLTVAGEKRLGFPYPRVYYRSMQLMLSELQEAESDAYTFECLGMPCGEAITSYRDSIQVLAEDWEIIPRGQGGGWRKVRTIADFTSVLKHYDISPTTRIRLMF